MPFPPSQLPRQLVDILADLSTVLFSRHMDADGTITYGWFSANVEAVFGYGAPDLTLTPKGALNAVHWADRDAHVEAVRASAAALERSVERFRIVTAAGETRWLRGSAQPSRNPDGSVEWEGAWSDITEWMRAEAHFQTVMDHAEDVILTIDAHAGIAWGNGAVERVLGWSIDELRGRCLATLLPGLCGMPEHIDPARCDLADTMRCFLRGTQEVSAIRKDGSTFPFEMTVSEVRADGRLSLIVIGRDITRRRQLERALTEGQKLEALGRLAGGVAHELNNMLGPILMNAEMLGRTAHLDERNQGRVARVIEAAKHSRDIVRNVLAYCRNQPQPLAPLDLAQIFRAFADLAASALPPSVKLEAHAPIQPVTVVGDPAQITQVLLNLANNASDAMGGIGILAVDLAVVPAGEPAAQAGLDPARAHAEIRVADTGCGMSPATMARIFDPFFTTKPIGQGTGLGLSVVQGLVKAMGGAISVDSQPSRGTVFRIIFPLADEAPP
ncbi:ATP-binding protein [Magnetospirillum sp. UT-4]|uniref:ATP-binding protein n=1 Tax=Magnetospirillum sp. UT-4 TaxID=2681467 RepID=UPI00137E5AE5|nr:ATP-binding protein [Magnetospirillum sp. UT-4]CAA7625221.1 putative Histidine kinase [Magnetospirillum sp. UT-4]